MSARWYIYKLNIVTPAILGVQVEIEECDECYMSIYDILAEHWICGERSKYCYECSKKLIRVGDRVNGRKIVEITEPS